MQDFRAKIQVKIIMIIITIIIINTINFKFLHDNSGHIGVPKQQDGGHVDAPKKKKKKKIWFILLSYVNINLL